MTKRPQKMSALDQALLLGDPVAAAKAHLRQLRYVHTSLQTAGVWYRTVVELTSTPQERGETEEVTRIWTETLALFQDQLEMLGITEDTFVNDDKATQIAVERFFRDGLKQLNSCGEVSDGE